MTCAWNKLRVTGPRPTLSRDHIDLDTSRRVTQTRRTRVVHQESGTLHIINAPFVTGSCHPLPLVLPLKQLPFKAVAPVCERARVIIGAWMRNEYVYDTPTPSHL